MAVGDSEYEGQGIFAGAVNEEGCDGREVVAVGGVEGGWGKERGEEVEDVVEVREEQCGGGVGHVLGEGGPRGSVKEVWC